MFYLSREQKLLHTPPALTFRKSVLSPQSRDCIFILYVIHSASDYSPKQH